MLIPLLFLLSYFFPNSVFAATDIGGCDDDDTVCKLGTQTTEGFGDVLSSIIQFIFIVAVILALGFLVYGGIRWLTSGGDKDSVAQARGTIIAAGIGLIVIFLSYFILNFVLLFLTGEGLDSIDVPRIVGGGGGGGSDQACTNGQYVNQPPGCNCPSGDVTAEGRCIL